MDVRVEEKGPVVRLVEVKVSGEDMRAEEDRNYNALKTKAKLKGFRQGKIPRTVLQKMYGKQVRQDAMQAVVQAKVQQLVKDMPQMIHVSPWRVLDAQTEGGGFTFEVDIEIRPEVEVSGYLGLEVNRPVAAISDEDVQKQLESMQQQYASLEPVEDRTVVESGDIVSIDYHAVGGGPLAKFRATEQQVEVGSGHAIEGLEAGLLGAALGQELDVVVTLPERYQPLPEMQGRPVTLKVTPRSLKRRRVPAIDDDLARDTGDAETLEQLRDVVRTRLEEGASKAAEEGARQNLQKLLRERFKFELPNGYIQDRVERRLREQAQMLLRYGMSPEQAMSILSGVEDRVRDEVVGDVQDEVILEAIAKREKIEVTAAEKSSYIDAKAKKLGLQLSQVQRLYRQPEMQSVLEGEVRREKTLDSLLAQAKLVDVDAKAQAAADAAAAESAGAAPEEAADAAPVEDKPKAKASRSKKKAEEAPPAAETSAESESEQEEPKKKAPRKTTRKAKAEE